MGWHRALTAVVLYAATGLLPVASAEEGVRYYEQDGLMYRETRIKLRHPVSDVRFKELKQTVYRDQYTTELKPVIRNTYVPVTTYAWQPEVHGKWNPLTQPYIAYRPVPKTSWSVQPQTVQVPVTRRVTVPEIRTLQVPQTDLRYEEREYVQRVPVGPAPTRGATSPPSGTAPPETHAGNTGGAPNLIVAGGNPSQLQPVYRPPDHALRQQAAFGGVARLEADPPRYGVATGSGR